MGQQFDTVLLSMEIYTNAVQGCLLEGTRGNIYHASYFTKKFQSYILKGNPVILICSFILKMYKAYNIEIPDTLKKVINYIDSISNDEIIYDPSNNPCER